MVCKLAAQPQLQAIYEDSNNDDDNVILSNDDAILCKDDVIPERFQR